MTWDALLRVVGAGIAIFAGGRSKRVVLVALASTGLSVAVWGTAATSSPSPYRAGVPVLVFALAAAGLFFATWPPLVGAAMVAGTALAVPACLATAFHVRNQGPFEMWTTGLTMLAGLSVLGAEASRANAEAGWRRALYGLLAVLLPSGLVVGLTSLNALSRQATTLTGRLAAPAAALAVALLSWLGASLGELRRVRRELLEEVRLGLLPQEDAAVLSVPWKRFFEKRFGRRDERRRYVESALLLAVARQQQRRRSGEAERLRQLEVLTFRTRVRRTLEARAARRYSSSDEIPRE